MTKSVEDDKDKWLIAQKLGIDTSIEMWQKYINDFSSIVKQYHDLSFSSNPYGTTTVVGNSGNVSGYVTQTDKGGTISFTSPAAIDFIQNSPVGATMDGANGIKFYKDEDGRTVVTAPDGAKAVFDPSSDSYTSIKTSANVQKEAVSSFVKNVMKQKYADGTLSASGGLSLVGEHGTELRVLNRGDGILPADITRNLMAWGQTTPMQYIGNKFGQAMNVTIQALNLPNVVDGQGFVDYIRNNMFGQVLSFVH